ncbi:MAG: VIT domain-containing protein, partial [Planctomycetales bacterium]
VRVVSAPAIAFPSESHGSSAARAKSQGSGLVARKRPNLAPDEPAEIGQTLTTQADLRRAILEDGSVLYLNRNTEVTVDASRRVALSQGQVYVEVAPRDPHADPVAATFLVKTPTREVAAHGTKFSVGTTGDATRILVAQGKVRVSGHEGFLRAGRQLLLQGEDAESAPAPRASHALDWTRDLMAAAEGPLTPAGKHDGGALIAVDPNGQEARLTLRKYHIDVHVEDGFARTTIDQTYFNHDYQRKEGTFYFPLPPDASLSRLAMYVNGKLMEGGMAERSHARNVFEEIVRTQRDPALLEWVDGSTFKMRVFPLEGRQEKRIVISYTQRLSSLYGRTSYRFPAGHNMQLVDRWSFKARIRHAKTGDWLSPTHDLRFDQDDGDLVLSARARRVKPNRDVVLESLDDERAAAGRPGDDVRFSGAKHEGSKYLMVRCRPRLDSFPRRERRDWVFLFESSGDRDPLTARVQADVVVHLLNHAEHDDTFRILTAGTRVKAFDDRPRTATPENIKDAADFLNKTHLVGALDLGQAFDVAKPLLEESENPYLVHLGSGIPILGEKVDKKL